MTRVEITYCVPCGHLDRAQSLQERLLSTFGRELEAVSLVTGDSGVFTVHVDGDLVFDKADDEYDPDAIVETVRGRVSAAD
ncbi:SelT/SelW/SelH family protein [Halovivax limisalsi]|uniref:SelT/SelW/SelH family protein n=1 Tax=Halovivax limisalsi TaxID=1453760 RepID=UPI001FFD525E|nr:Rdx family protein [Halovivax limisalsi]